MKHLSRQGWITRFPNSRENAVVGHVIIFYLSIHIIRVPYLTVAISYSRKFTVRKVCWGGFRVRKGNPSCVEILAPPRFEKRLSPSGEWSDPVNSLFSVNECWVKHSDNWLTPAHVRRASTYIQPSEKITLSFLYLNPLVQEQVDPLIECYRPWTLTASFYQWLVVIFKHVTQHLGRWHASNHHRIGA